MAGRLAHVDTLKGLLILLGGKVVRKSHNDGGENVRAQWVLIERLDGSHVLLAERWYREGAVFLLNPSEEEIAAAERDPSSIWNNPRVETLFSPGSLR